MARKLPTAASGFEQLLRTSKFCEYRRSWVNFGGTRPGSCPPGPMASKEDLEVYENVAAVIESDGNHNQVIIGTLVKSAMSGD